MRFIKKLLTLTLVFMMAFTLVPVMALASDTITVTIDGHAVDFEDQEPIMVSNRVLVPVRFVFEDLGFEVDWDRDTRTATLDRDDFVVVIAIGSTSFTINGARHELDVPAQLIGGRTMIPLGPVLRGVGYELDWVSRTRTVVITTDAETTPPVDTAVAEAELAAFLSGMDMDLIQFALGGVDFTVGVTEHDMNMPGATASYRFLNLNGTLDITIPSGTQYISRLYSTQTGDVIMRRIVIEIDGEVVRADYAVGIDLGSAIDVWTAYPDFIPSWMVEEWGGVPYWLTTERAIYWIFGAGLYRESVISIKHFLYTRHDTVREILGVDFTPDSTEWASSGPAGYNWLALHPTTPVSLDAFEANYQSNMFTTQTGDVFIATFRYDVPNAIGAIYLYIDLGSLYDVFGAEQVDIWRDEGYELTEADRMFHRVQLWVQE